MTPERYHRICQMLAARQPDLTVCLEHVHKPHNISAIIRTADAVGIHTIHAIWSAKQLKIRQSAAAGSNSWIQLKTHANIETAIAHCKQQGMQILATHLSKNASEFRDIDYTKPTCIILGQEKTGISSQALALADHHIIIPMNGMVQSLNVSVAASLIFYEAQRQRQSAGFYQQTESRLDWEEQQRLLFEGGYPVLARVAKQKGLARPFINEQGAIIADPEWWKKMQSAQAKVSNRE